MDVVSWAGFAGAEAVFAVSCDSVLAGSAGLVEAGAGAESEDWVEVVEDEAFAPVVA